MSPEQKEDHLKNKGIKCPYCKSRRLTANHIQTDTGIAWQEVVCDKCGNNWTDQYELANVEPHEYTAEG